MPFFTTACTDHAMGVQITLQIRQLSI